MQLSKLFSAIALTAGLALGVASSANAGKLTIGVSPVPHADIINFVAPQLKDQGVDVKVVEFNDYVQPNLALADKSLDANFFQHKPYLDTFASEHKLNLSVLCAVHIEPMGVYAKKIKNIADTPNGTLVGIPNDPTNGGRALKVLENAGLIKVRPEAGVLATQIDITDNPRKLKFIEIEAAQLPRALDDVGLAVINSNFALSAGLNPVKDAIAIEAKDSPYANIVAVRTGDEVREDLQKLKAALATPELREFLEKKFGGSVVPAF